MNEKEQLEKENIQIEARGLLEMYQAGFIDGYCMAKHRKIKDKILWHKLRFLCKTYFDKRFSSNRKI